MQETQETQVRSLSQEDPLEEEMATTPVFLLGKSCGQRRLAGHSPWGHQESDATEHVHARTHAHTHTHTHRHSVCSLEFRQDLGD